MRELKHRIEEKKKVLLLEKQFRKKSEIGINNKLKNKEHLFGFRRT
jgi:hypothetical protein